MIEEENLSEERTDVARARDGHAGGGIRSNQQQSKHLKLSNLAI